MSDARESSCSNVLPSRTVLHSTVLAGCVVVGDVTLLGAQICSLSVNGAESIGTAKHCNSDGRSTPTVV